MRVGSLDYLVQTGRDILEHLFHIQPYIDTDTFELYMYPGMLWRDAPQDLQAKALKAFARDLAPFLPRVHDGSLEAAAAAAAAHKKVLRDYTNFETMLTIDPQTGAGVLVRAPSVEVLLERHQQIDIFSPLVEMVTRARAPEETIETVLVAMAAASKHSGLRWACQVRLLHLAQILTHLLCALFVVSTAHLDALHGSERLLYLCWLRWFLL